MRSKLGEGYIPCSLEQAVNGDQGSFPESVHSVTWASTDQSELH